MRPSRELLERTGSRPQKRLAKGVFVGVLALWMMIPVMLRSLPSPDAATYFTAGKLATSHPNNIYNPHSKNPWLGTEAFKKQWCKSATGKSACDVRALAFFGPPTSIPILALVAVVDRGVAIFLYQFVCAAMLVVGMALLWRRLAHRSKHAPELLAISTIVLTPMAFWPILLGQLSPIMFLSISFGIASVSRRGKFVRGAVWAVAVLVKASPILLLPLLAAKRRRFILVSAIGILVSLSVVSLLIAPFSLWSDFVKTTLHVGAAPFKQQASTSLGALVAKVVASTQLNAVIRLGLAASLSWFTMRKLNDDSCWALGYVALIVLLPLVWWHYMWVVIGAIAILIAEYEDLPDKVLVVLPIVGSVASVPVLMALDGQSTSNLNPLLFSLGLVVVLLLSVAIRRQQTPTVHAAPTARLKEIT